MQVCPDRPACATALVAALAVVAEAGDDSAQGLGALLEDRPPGMVLEAGERPLRARLQLALEQHGADHPARSRNGVERQQADAGQLLAALVAVETAKQLVAAADGEECGSGVKGLA